MGTHVAPGGSVYTPLAEQWTGARWRVMSAPAPGRSSSSLLTEVSCQAHDNCVAIGYRIESRGYALLAEHWNGRRWRIILSANPAGVSSAFFNNVTCAARVGCLAVGAYSSQSGEGHALAERWAVGRWRLIRLPLPTGAKATELNGVSCDNGKCLAVGTYQSAKGQMLPLAERWTGRSWRLLHPTTVRAPASTLADVSCAAPSVCLAVGDSQWTHQYPLAELWQNGRWQVVPGGRVSGGTLSGVSCQRTWCMAVGTAGARSLTEVWYGINLRVVRTPRAGGRPADQLNELSCRTGNGRCVAVGARYRPSQVFDDATLAEWWGGRTWHVMTTRNP